MRVVPAGRYVKRMNPRLVVVAGRLKDSAYELGDEDVSVGRESSNRLSIPDSLLSRRHCIVRREGAGYRLIDLDSLNATFVNGKPVRERLLEHGDQISIGETRFVFLSHDGDVDVPRSSPVEMNEREFTAHTTLRMRVEDVLQPHEDWTRLPALASMARDLTLLVKISTTINSIRDAEELQREFLRFVFEVVPAERGAILLVGEEGDIISEFGLERDGSSGQSVKVSRTVVRQVLEERAAILASDLIESSNFNASESLKASRISSLLCAPLVLFGRAVGIIYLTALAPGTHFDEEHLRLVTIISGVAAVALNNARHVEQLQSENTMLREESRIEHGMIGESARMRQVYQLIARVAPTDTTILIRGESGTGKELAAQAIHQNSPRLERAVRRHQLRCAHGDASRDRSCSVTRKARSRARSREKRASSKSLTAARSFSTRSARCRPCFRRNCCACLQEREFERVGGTRTIKR